MKKITLIFAVLIGSMFTILTSCKTDPKTSTTDSKVDFKHTENIVYTRLRADADNLNPYLYTGAYSQQVSQYMFPYLLYFHPETLELSPILAKGRPDIKEITEGEYKGGLSFTFEIHEEAVWDNGEPVTGHDAVFSLKAIFDPKVPTRGRQSYGFVKDIKVDEENPKRFTLYSDVKNILSEVQASTLVILPEHVYDANGYLKDYTFKELRDQDNANRLAEKDSRLQDFADFFGDTKFSREKGYIKGCGPYAFEEWETKQRIILKKKENWWGDKLAAKYPLLEAKPKELHFKVISDQNTAIAALKDQDLDAIDQMQPKDYMELEKSERLQELYDFSAPARLVGYATFLNLRKAKLQDKNVRRAIAHLFDINKIIEDVLYGMGRSITGPIHPSKSYYAKDLPMIEFNPTKAKELLTNAGWTDSNGNGTIDKEIDGEVVEMTLDYLFSSDTEQDIALLFQNSAKPLGVDVNLIRKEFVTKMESIKKRDFDLSAGGWRTYPMPFDPEQAWHSNSDNPSGGNYSGFRNERVDELSDKIVVEIDDTKRVEMYKEFQEIIYDEQPYIFLFAPLNPTATSKRFKPQLSSMGYYPNMFELKTDFSEN